MLFHKKPHRILKLNGFRCIILKNKEMEFLTGYVMNIQPITSEQADSIDCHGGITWHEKHSIGFDCAHLGDDFKLPSIIANSLRENPIFAQAVYRDETYVTEQLRLITRQLKALNIKPQGY